MYVLAKDGADETLDVNDTIATSVAAIQKWFVGQTQGKHKIRFDTNHNALDVTFLRLMQTDAEIASSGAHVRDRIEDELKKAGFNYPKKIYAVYYGGSSNYACGGGPWPPTLIGKVDLTFHQKAGEEDQLFGSVTSQDIQELLEKQGYKIDRKKIVLSSQQEIEAAATQARPELKVYAAELAVSLAEKKINVDEATDRALVRNFVAQIDVSKDGR